MQNKGIEKLLFLREDIERKDMAERIREIVFVPSRVSHYDLSRIRVHSILVKGWCAL